MGQEVSHSHFTEEEMTLFRQRLIAETKLLKQQFEDGLFSSCAPVGGFEIEGWLLDDKMKPASVNDAFFEALNNPLATPELAKFNIELNNLPLPLKADAFNQFERDMLAVYDDARKAAIAVDSDVVLVGILPTLEARDCSLANMSEMKRYHALNDVVFKIREGRPLLFDIHAKDSLTMESDNLMFEAATTSFQIHMQMPWQQAHHYYNASIIASAPLMAMAANAPLLFSKQLWQETRIPLFEQSVDTGDGLRRVSFGTGYAKESIVECFEENLQEFAVLLPMLFDDDAEKFSHLRLHNGVIWRWNRPLVGFDDDGTPHVRIEQRILPAGPTLKDMVANAAFFYGLTQSLVNQIEQGIEKMPFVQAKDNFYQAAQNGLESTLVWNQKRYGGEALKALLIDELIPLAAAGLSQLNIDADSSAEYLEIIKQRVQTGQTGAVWQLKHLEAVNGDLAQLTHDYMILQSANQPVHTWEV